MPSVQEEGKLPVSNDLFNVKKKFALLEHEHLL